MFALIAPITATGAQAIGGRLRDAATGRPIHNVGVSVRGDTAHRSKPKESGMDGTFILELPEPGRYQIRFDVAKDVVLFADSVDVTAEGFVQREFTLRVPDGAVFYEFQVERPVGAAIGAQGLRYPVNLRDRHIDGDVFAEFIVDTTGLVRPGSARAVRATHPEFAQAVLTSLAQMHFTPAMRDGRTVAQFVQMPFSFTTH